MPWPVDESYIFDCEKAIGFRLPEAYRTSMMTQNGGAVFGDGEEWNLHPVWDKSDKKRLKRTSNDVVRETKAMANWIGWPDNAVCIAGNGEGDALFLSSNSKITDTAVYRWCHESGQSKKVADSFSELRRA